MPGKLSTAVANRRKRFIKKAVAKGVAQKNIATRLKITPGRVSQLSKGMKKGKNARTVLADNRKRFVAKAIGYTKATEAQIAERAGITARHTRRIVRMQGSKQRKYKLKTGPKGFDTKRKLSKENIDEIRQIAKEQKLSQHKLAKMFGVTQPRIQQILKKN